MVIAGAILKCVCPKLLCVTCTPHVLHNCGVKVISHFEDINQLIAKVKLATVKNKTRQAKFVIIGCPPQPVVTRWKNWLNPALYYAKNLPEVKPIVESLEGSCILVTQAKVSFQTTGLDTQLLQIKNQYKCQVKLMETKESAKYSIKEAVQAIQEIGL